MRPSNINELRDQLLDAYEAVKADPLRVTQVREMTNAAGRVISTLKVQLTYHALRNEVPLIPFMECPRAIGDGTSQDQIEDKAE